MLNCIKTTLLRAEFGVGYFRDQERKGQLTVYWRPYVCSHQFSNVHVLLNSRSMNFFQLRSDFVHVAFVDNEITQESLIDY